MNLFLLLLLLLTASLSATESITVDLREPVLEAGKLSTVRGGVITGPNFRLQAENIVYVKRKGEHRVEASCFVMVDFGDYVFVGDRLEYDFENETGFIENGTSRQLPWYFGGDRVEICPDGSYVIYNAYVTTSENDSPDWEIRAEKMVLSRNRNLHISHVQFRALNLPFLWLPAFKMNLSSFTDAPLHGYAKWGGKQGFRVGAQYALWDSDPFRAYLRLDWRFDKGLGGGVETYYESDDGRHSLETINYFAQDNSLENLHEKERFRFQGLYHSDLMDDTVSVFASWDKLSDKDMATDYNDEGLELDTAGRTELLIRKEDPWLITNFTSRVRVNSFQTVKQELPSLLFTQRPFILGKSGILVENTLETSYLDFKYASDIPHVHDYSSPRLMHDLRLLRPFHPPATTLTPHLGMTTMIYADSPEHNAKYLAIGYAGLTGNTQFYRTIGPYKHVITPYFEWRYLSAPTVNPDGHYIFDIDDGLWRLNALRVGTRHDLVINQTRKIEADLFGYLFTDSAPIQKLYANVTWRPTPTLKQSIESGWDFTVSQLDHLNFRNDWTVNTDCAVSLEWRHRSRYSWRKAVWNNFILDSFRSTRSLLHSTVSDRRDTFLCHLFWRLHPLFAIEFESRHGWYRRKEPSYTEFEINFLARLRSHWTVKLSYAHTEADDRVRAYFSLDLNRPLKESNYLIQPLAF